MSVQCRSCDSVFDPCLALLSKSFVPGLIWLRQPPSTPLSAVVLTSTNLFGLAMGLLLW